MPAGTPAGAPVRARRHQPRRRLAGTGLLVLTGRPFSGARHGDRVRDIAESEHALLRAARAAWAAHPGPREDCKRYRPSGARVISQAASRGGPRLRLRYLGAIKDNAWLKHRGNAVAVW